MMKRSLVLLPALAAACGGDPQIVLELIGAVPDARHVDVVLLEPVVLAREQRHNNPLRLDGGTLETVFYMEERSRLTFDLAEGRPTDHLRFEIQGAGGPFVPLVMVRRDALAGQPEPVAALGVYDPSSIFEATLGASHVPRSIGPVGDVTIFPIELEAVDRAFAPTTLVPPVVKIRELMLVPCAATGNTSGFAWRRADGLELRVLAQLPAPAPGAAGAEGRLDPPDLDCDQHSPGRYKIVGRDVDGDRRDCDDTAFLVHGSARERCSRLDDDCNPDTTLSPAPCSVQCNSTLQLCACDDAGSPDSCLLPLSKEPCRLPATSSDGPGRRPCDSLGPVTLPLCANGCRVLLEWAPEGMEVGLSDDPGTTRYGLGEWATLTDAKAFLSVHATASFELPLHIVIGRVQAALGSVDFAIPLQLSDPGPCEGPPAPLVCPIL